MAIRPSRQIFPHLGAFEVPRIESRWLHPVGLVDAKEPGDPRAANSPQG
jgi:hypothetical protein